MPVTNILYIYIFACLVNQPNVNNVVPSKLSSESQISKTCTVTSKSLETTGRSKTFFFIHSLGMHAKMKWYSLHAHIPQFNE